ncbi:hypothetical protein VTJ04DRAFT_4832 [Mycothermus thermophilus]|uniref:uncharacterized protein n=1 Tax=Humicola insolens TaxID=85995 RepID=UPI0037423BD5
MEQLHPTATEDIIVRNEASSMKHLLAVHIPFYKRNIHLSLTPTILHGVFHQCLFRQFSHLCNMQQCAAATMQREAVQSCKA